MKTTEFNVDALHLTVCSTRADMGASAAAEAAQIIRAALIEKAFARIIVASAPSQDELIASLAASSDIDWSRVTVFHMDEYVGIAASDPASFRSYQQHHLLTQVTPGAFHGIRGEAPDPQEECDRYADLLNEAPIDLVCMGVGENGHIAFNDPPVADFDDPRWAKVVELDEVCRRQQVNDGCFPNLDSVPKHAITLTCPALMRGRKIVCVVPGPRKAAAIAAMLRGPISTACPASILRRHRSARLFLDLDSASGIS